MNHFPDPNKRRAIAGFTEAHIAAAAKHLYGADTITDAARMDRNRLRNYISGRAAWTFP